MESVEHLDCRWGGATGGAIASVTEWAPSGESSWEAATRTDPLAESFGGAHSPAPGQTFWGSQDPAPRSGAR